ncbi:MAG TPA: HAMP domain-containing sensor histidine kinase, partial [Stenomitos sp.]
GNAVKHHTRDNGQVVITSQQLQEGLYRFDVVDDGPGIPPDYHATIFEIFRTFGAPKNVDSTGIGLAIVKKLIELQGGTINVESEVGKGTVFWFTWPVKRAFLYQN